jgi:hypothetical protein
MDPALRAGQVNDLKIKPGASTVGKLGPIKVLASLMLTQMAQSSSGKSDRFLCGGIPGGLPVAP